MCSLCCIQGFHYCYEPDRKIQLSLDNVCVLLFFCWFGVYFVNLCTYVIVWPAIIWLSPLALSTILLYTGMCDSVSDVFIQSLINIPFHFQKRKYFLAPDTEKELDDWIGNLQRVMRFTDHEEDPVPAMLQSGRCRCYCKYNGIALKVGIYA